MTSSVLIIDYGLGNLHSVCRAVEHCGGDPVLSSDPTALRSADRVILPGVGAFQDGMAGLASFGLVEPIQEFAASGRPFLGICLGMQMMMDTSEEFGIHRGLGLVAGTVVAIPSMGIDGTPHKVPHVGWNQLHMLPGNPWEGTLLQSTKPGSSVYFVHSFAAVPTLPTTRLADCHYDGQPICAAISLNNMFGCQFHPEVSGEVGLGIIRAFLSH